MRTTIASVILNVVQPLTVDKGNVIGHVVIPPQLLTECILYSRPIQWILHQISPAEDSNKRDISMEEFEDTTGSKGAENQKALL